MPAFGPEGRQPAWRALLLSSEGYGAADSGFRYTADRSAFHTGFTEGMSHRSRTALGSKALGGNQRQPGAVTPAALHFLKAT